MIFNNPLVYNPMLTMEQRLNPISPLDSAQSLSYNPMLSQSQRSLLDPIGSSVSPIDYAPMRQPLPHLNNDYIKSEPLIDFNKSYIKPEPLINLDNNFGEYPLMSWKS
jgi:hypothetical protein